MSTTPAVLYLRVSTDKQETSIEQQRTEIQAHAAKHNYTIVREYVDEAISGDETEKRTAFKQMLQDVTRGDFKVVLCWDQDRFGRFDPLEAGYWIKPLRDHGVRLETIAQGKIDWEDFAGRIVYAVQQEAKHAYLRDLSRNVARGMMAAMREGKWQGGRPPFGYQVVDQRLVPADPVSVALVRRIYEEYAYTETSIRALAFKLTTEGVPSPEGGMWSPPVIQRLLKAPVYLGNLVWNRRCQAKYFGIEGGAITSKNRQSARGFNPKADWLTKQGTHEPLIELELWETVQRRLHERRSRTSPVRGSGFMLGGLVVCAHCGRVMYGGVERQHGIDHFYLRCGSYSSFGKTACENYKINERPLAALVVRKLRATFTDSSGLALLVAELHRRIEQRHQRNPEHLRLLETSIASLERKIDEGTKRYLTAPRHLMPGIEEMLSGWSAELEQAKRKRAAVPPPVGIADVGRLVERCVRRLADLECANPAQVNAVLRGFTTKVECSFERVPFGTKKRTKLTNGMIHALTTADISGLVAHGGPSSTPTGDTR